LGFISVVYVIRLRGITPFDDASDTYFEGLANRNLYSLRLEHHVPLSWRSLRHFGAMMERVLNTWKTTRLKN
jgi:hypothetical protein